MELTLKKPAKAKAARPKSILNLATHYKKKVNVPAVIIGVLIGAAAVFAVGKFLVYDRFAALESARAEAAAIQAKIDDNYAKIRALDGISDEFAHYTFTGMTDDELTLVSRVDVMDMIKRVVLSDAKISSWNLQSNTLRLNLYDTTFAGVNSIVAAMEAEPLVNYSFMQTAATEDSEVLLPGTAVTAQITAYLQIPEQEDAQ